MGFIFNNDTIIMVRMGFIVRINLSFKSESIELCKIQFAGELTLYPSKVHVLHVYIGTE